MGIFKGLKIQFAIGMLVTVAVICTVLIALYSSHVALKGTLKERYLENNYAYAKKLSTSTGDLLSQMQTNITALGNIVSHHNLDQRDLDEWRISHYFNSVFMTNKEGVIQSISPEVVSDVKAGTKLESETMKKALSIKASFISEPYRAPSGRLILLLSSPIFDNDGNYKGLVGGTIYLEGENAIKNMLNNHNYDDGSYVYVVDSAGKIIYHPYSSRINEDIYNNKMISKVLIGKSGSEQITNVEGNEFFAGYANIPSTGWGIISQTPTSVMDEPLQNLSKMMISRALPLLLLIVLIGWVLTRNLSKPINRLAKLTEEASHRKNTSLNVTSIQTNSTIYEIRQLYHHITNYFTLLNNQIQLDGLTGLANRRTFDLILDELVNERAQFSLIMLDIDYFKKVNDTYGHLVGDDVLKHLAQLMNSLATEDDICFRYGGEEFGVVVKNKNQEEAFLLAETLRKLVEVSPNPTGQRITISLGISSLYKNDEHGKQIVERADNALYKSKTNGRNRTTLYIETDSTL